MGDKHAETRLDSVLTFVIETETAEWSDATAREIELARSIGACVLSRRSQISNYMHPRFPNYRLFAMI